MKVEESATKMYEMKLNETILIGNTTAVTRVPGGWIYELLEIATRTVTSQFVPFDNEFQK
jgi:hypothetical protein